MTPTSEQDVSDFVRDADGPVSITGGGTRGLHGDGARLSLSALSGVTLYEPGALTLVVQAGTPICEINDTLAQAQQRLAFEPMDHRGLLGSVGTPTIGGVMAANVSGPRRIQCGAARDFALGVRFVDGTGALIKNGGRVMKNVTGYDLVKLMCGSMGRLGVLTQVSLKVLPMPEAEVTVQISADTAKEAVAIMTSAMGSAFDISGAAYEPTTKTVSLRLEGFEKSVAYRADALRGHLRKDTQTADASAAVWQSIRDVAPFHDQPGDVWRVSVKPTDGSNVLNAVSADGALLDWSGGLVWLRVPEGTDVRARLSEIDGHATLVRASTQTKASLGVFEPEPPVLAALTAGIRAKFDPRGILNADAPRIQAA